MAGRTPERNSNSRRASGVLRASRGGGVRPARPVGSQKHSLFLSGSACRPSPPSGFAAGRQGRRFGEPHYSLSAQSSAKKHSPILRPVSASLRLRFRSATFSVARGNSCRIGRVPTGRICPLWRAGDGFFVGEQVFSRACGGQMAASTPILCSRALGNLVKTRKRILTISLLRRRRAI